MNVQRRYRKWWVGEECRLFGSHSDYKLVNNLVFLGPPSMVYGEVYLVYSDGTNERIIHPLNTFRPRKKDVDVQSQKKITK